MKKIISMVALFAAVLGCQTAKANSDGEHYYGKATVEVAEDSKGLGTIYFIDKDEDGNEFTTNEIKGDGQDAQMPPAGYWNLTCTLQIEPAEGYVLQNLTDQDGNIYMVEGNDVSLHCTSTDEANPTTYNLQAHFIDASLVKDQELVEVTISDENVYGTFCAPVEATVPEDLVVYNVTGVEDDAVTIVRRESNVVPAFTPVLIMNDGWYPATITASYVKDELPEVLPEMKNGLLTGVLEDTAVPVGAYTLPEEGYYVEFTKVDDSMVIIPAYTAYMTLDSENENNTFSYMEVEAEDPGNGGETGVSTILDGLKKGNIYTIDGKKIDRLQEGINIVNGVKVIVK